MDKWREIISYTKLNFQRCIYQGKTAIILLCLIAFFQIYLGDVRGILIRQNQTLGLGELFLAITNNNYTAFTIWAGFILLICDTPYRDEEIYQYLLRTSKKSWLVGQLLYLLGITLLYLIFLFFLLFFLIVPQVTLKLRWTGTFFQMVNTPGKYGIENWFVFPVSILRMQTPMELFPQCFIVCLLAGMVTGFLTMLFHMLWKNGPGIMLERV